eukprot:PhM_4_TR13539/c0_g1_i1/m.83287/K13681/FUT; xyloglucan fucosyltransferase
MFGRRQQPVRGSSGMSALIRRNRFVVLLVVCILIYVCIVQLTHVHHPADRAGSGTRNQDHENSENIDEKETTPIPIKRAVLPPLPTLMHRVERKEDLKPLETNVVKVGETEAPTKPGTPQPTHRFFATPAPPTKPPNVAHPNPNIHTSPISDALRQALHTETVAELPPSKLSRNRLVTMYGGNISLAAKKGTAWGLLEKYAEFHRAEMNKPSSKRRIAIVRPMGQLCNRLMTITSAFLFSTLTKRALLVSDGDFYCSMDDLFEHPDFNWLLNDRSDGGAEDGDVLRNPEWGSWEQAEPLLCSADYEKAFPHRVATVAMNQYIVPAIARNPHYRDAINELFGGLDHVFYTLSHFLFRPIPKLKTKLASFLETHKFDEHYVVGLQVRSGPDFTSNFMQKDAWGLYRDCAEASTPPHLQSKLRFFVATDTEDGREFAKRYLGKENVWFGPTEFMRSNNPEGVQMALLDLLILASSHDRVTTAWSSYGYFAAGYAGIAANMVTALPDSAPTPTKEPFFMGIVHKNDARRQCVRLGSSQPCFHKFATWGGLKVSCAKKTWYDEEMRRDRYC